MFFIKTKTLWTKMAHHQYVLFFILIGSLKWQCESVQPMSRNLQLIRAIQEQRVFMHIIVVVQVFVSFLFVSDLHGAFSNTRIN